MTSPFARARTIRDIGSYMPAAIGGQYSREEHREAVTKWHAQNEKPLPATVHHPEFFRNSTFDSEILELEFTPDLVRVTVGMDDGYEFARDLSHLLGIPFQRDECPVDLLMHEPRYVRAVVSDEFGILSDIAVPNMTSGPELRIGNLQNEWFFSHGDHLGWVAEIYGTHPPLRADTHLLVDCARASAIDRRLETLVAAFGPACEALWNDAVEHFGRPDSALYGWGNDIYEFLEERLKTRGLTTTDFTCA